MSIEKTPWDTHNPKLLQELEAPFNTCCGDNPLTAAMALCTVYNEEKDRVDMQLDSVQRYYQGKSIMPHAQSLKPYLAKRPRKPSFVWRMWLYSTLRLVFWRELVFAGVVTTAWFTLFVYRSQAQTIIANAISMFDVLIFAIGIFLAGFVDRVLDLYGESKRSYDEVLSLTEEFASSACVLAEARLRKEIPVTSQTIDLVVDLNMYMHCIPYCVIGEVRQNLQFDVLPLLHSQKKELRTRNGDDMARIRTLFTLIKLTLSRLENEALFSTDTASLSLFKYEQMISDKLVILRAEISNEMPTRYVDTLTWALLIFCTFLPTIVFDMSDWWWGYVFMVLLVYVLYGFFQQSKEIHNPISLKSSTNNVDVPVVEKAHVCAFTVDNEFQQLLKLLLKKAESSTVVLDKDGVITGIYKSHVREMKQDVQTSTSVYEHPEHFSADSLLL